MIKNSKLLGAILLITGTSVGAGILALPVITALYGFIPSLLLFIGCWLCMLLAAFYFLEVALWLPMGTNLVSMAKTTLGKPGQVVAWLAYLLLLYCLMSAYLSGMNALIHDSAASFLHENISAWLGGVLLIVIFGIIIYLGAKKIDLLNRVLMAGLITTFIAMIFLLSAKAKPENLSQLQFNHFWLALPIITTAFGFQIIIPSLCTYLNNDVRQLRKAIFIGATLPLVFYIIWEILIMAVLPTQGSNGLLAILHAGQPATGLSTALAEISHGAIVPIAKWFAFFTISTSFIGVSLSLFDFLTDGLHIKRNKLGRLTTALITFVPPLIFVLLYPQGFILALGYAGTCVALLLCILPASMILAGRYQHHLHKSYRVWGSWWLPLLLILFAVLVIVVEIK